MSTPIPAERLRALNSGGAAATHLAECLAVDFAALLQGVAMRPLADDPHFGVREWAWLALRSDIVAAPSQALEYLYMWTQEASPYLRRFACEALRPRGVWSTHIALFKQHPELALPMLEAMANDPERYVQDSVGNWLNDAGKTQPQWLRELCARWQQQHPGDANAYIRKRALRSLR